MYDTLCSKCAKNKQDSCGPKRVNKLRLIIKHTENYSLLANSGSVNWASGPHSSGVLQK